MQRRTVLRALAVASGTAVTAGCLFDSEESTVALGDIRLSNERSEHIEVELTVETSDETLYEETHELGPQENPNERATTVEEPWMDEAATYEVSSSVASVGTETVSTERFGDVTTGCVLLSIEIEETIETWVAAGETEDCE